MWNSAEIRAFMTVVDIPATRSGPGPRTMSRAQRMLGMRRMDAQGSGCDIDIEIALLNAQRVPRHGGRNSWPRLPSQAMKHPAVPGADDVIVFD